MAAQQPDHEHGEQPDDDTQRHHGGRHVAFTWRQRSSTFDPGPTLMA